MNRTRLFCLPLLLAAEALPAAAQAPKISGLVQVWYGQMLDSNLRLNSTNVLPASLNGTRKYYNLRSEFTENGFAIRRTELKFSGKLWSDEAGNALDYEVMIDPSIGSNGTNANHLQDAALHLKLASGLEAKVGQFKSQQTFEGVMSSSELMFAERSQMGRTLGDTRDRGGILSFSLGDPKSFGAKAVVGVFNGSGKTNDLNAQKDFIGRMEFTAAKAHRFGFYTLQGGTDQADKGGLSAKTFAGATAPTSAEVLDQKDKTTNYGAYYVYQDATWTFMAEAITGQLGRRAASLGTGVAGREHLEQKFLGYYGAAAFTFGHHTFALRYDVLDYNKGGDWYTAYNPYTHSNATTLLAGDFTPRYTEITGGWTYALKPESVKAANLKVNYIARSKNFLAPRASQTGAQGGNTLLVAFQVAF